MMTTRDPSAMRGAILAQLLTRPPFQRDTRSDDSNSAVGKTRTSHTCNGPSYNQHIRRIGNSAQERSQLEERKKDKEGVLQSISCMSQRPFGASYLGAEVCIEFSCQWLQCATALDVSVPCKSARLER